ncbi:TBC1 domain family member 31-like [Artemia franciscana]|uniref:TBC1 domain family member 31-like n=1 Tax=Artemia franciscana TaxID=6661 RepID=UPI0032D9BB40
MLRDGLTLPQGKRAVIWAKILNLPKLKSAYIEMSSSRGICQTGIERVKENLRHDLGMCLPFVECLITSLFASLEERELLIYEIVRTIVDNWCKEWVLMFPNIPFPSLAFCSALMKHHIPEVFQHMAHIKAEESPWFLLSTFFSKVTEPSKWLDIMDVVIANHPSFILLLPVAYFRIHQKKILQMTDRLSLQKFLESPSTFTDPGRLARIAYECYEGTPSHIHPLQCVRDFEPLQPAWNGSYPSVPQSAFAAISKLRKEDTTLNKNDEIDFSSNFEPSGGAPHWESVDSVLDAGFSIRKDVTETLRKLSY